MKFWQAVVVAQMAAGMVRANQHEHMLKSAVSATVAMFFGWVLWIVLAALFRKEDAR